MNAFLPLLLLTLTLVVIAVHGEETLNCDNIDQDLSPGKVIAIGARKQIAEAYSQMHGPVLVAEAWNGTWYRAHLKDKQRDAAYLAYVVGERDELRAAANHDQFPRMFGGCWNDLWSAKTVLEYVEGWLTLCDDSSIDFNQRLVIAAKSLDLIGLFDRFPIPGPSGLRRVLLHEYHPQMFAINATYDIKLVSHNQQRLVYYSSKQAYGSDFSCDSDRDCSVHFVDAKQIGAGLQLPEPPLEFGCNKQLHRCHGLDWRLNLFAIAHVLWKPLFGLGGHPLAGGVVSDFFRPKIQQIVDAASAHDPADRPPIDDLRNALFSLVRGQVAPYCVPQNIGVTSFSTQRDKADKMLHGAPNKDAPRWDVPETIELPKLSHGEKPITLTNWFFKFQPTPQMPMTVRLLGVYNEQPWGSSPIYVRQNATLLRTRSGKAYMLRGAVNCEGLKTEGFTDEFCHKFHYGFPSRWKENLSDAWDTLQNTLRKQFFAKHAPKTPLKYDAAEWIDRSELSMSRGGAGSASEDFVVALSSEESEGSAFSIRTKAKSGGVAHAVWLSASATDTTTTADTAGDQVSEDDDATETSATNHEVVSEKPGDAAAVKQLLADERAEKNRLAALASKSPCGAEGLEAEGVCCLLTCGTCGGARCETHTGGRAGCCPDQIHRSGLLCHDNLPPCILQSIAASKVANLPQRVSAPRDACSWAPSVGAMPYDIEESHALVASASIGAKRCTVPQESVQVGVIPHSIVARGELMPNQGRITVDIAVTVVQAPLELVIGIGNGTSNSFQQQITVFRFNGDTKHVEVAKNPVTTPPDKLLFHDVAEGMTFNIRAVINPIARTLDVVMRDFVAGAPPMHEYAKAVPFVSNAQATPFTPAVAVGGIADTEACANRLGFATLLRKGRALVCFGTIVTTKTLAPAPPIATTAASTAATTLPPTTTTTQPLATSMA